MVYKRDGAVHQHDGDECACGTECGEVDCCWVGGAGEERGDEGDGEGDGRIVGVGDVRKH